MKHLDKIKKIIQNSGNDFHQQVANLLRGQGWDVEFSPYYNDPATNKPREIDIVALKKYDVSDIFNRNSSSLTLRLFIECKYIKDVNVLWFRTKDIDSATKLAKNNSILRSLEDYCLQDTSTIPNKIHHYIRDNEVMKLVSKEGNSDPLYEGMNGCLNATVFYTQYLLDAVPNIIDFPIIVVNNFKNLYKRNLNNTDGHEDIIDNIQMEVNYSFTDKQGDPATKYFLLDIVNGEKLEYFLDMLDKNDIQILLTQLNWQHRLNSFKKTRDGDANSFKQDEYI
jgi:hypothetical protein